MSKLQILIPQYNENEDKIKPLLDSIAFQQDIDLKHDIEVFIGNDGSDIKLSIEFLKQYPYPIQYHIFDHTGLAGTRKNLFSLVSAPYVMWCDADDQFISTIALSLIMLQIDKGFEALICNFIEQNTYPDGKIAYIPREDDCIFVHGKVYNTKFLKYNKIEWHPELHEHQDSPFNVLARTCAKKQILCKMPIYMWCNNKESISRKNGIYHNPNTWPHMIDSYQALINDLKDRGYGEQARYYSKYCLYATYYEMSHKVWNQDDVLERKNKTYKRLIEFYKQNELLIQTCSSKYTDKMIAANKQIALRRGPLEEMPPFEEWLNSILTLY